MVGKTITYAFYPLIWFLLKTQDVGAQTSLALCYMDFDNIKNGQYYSNNVVTDTFSNAKDKDLRDEFIMYSWMLIDKITKDKYTIPKLL